MKKKHIAVLSTMYYPDMGAPSACIDKYVRSLKDDYVFHIITRTDVIGFELCKDYDVRYISSFRHRLITKCNNNITEGRNALLCKIVLLVINICKLFQTQYSFPSAQKWEVVQYARELQRLHDEVMLYAVIAVSNTAFTQLATLQFKKNNPGVKWISVFFDPYSENYIYYKHKLFKKIWRCLNRQKEQDIYDNADSCMFTSELFKFVPRSFNIASEKVHKMEFVLNRLTIPSHSLSSNTVHSCRLIYAGMFYKTIRNPEFALSTLSKVSDIQLDLFVGRGECEDIIDNFKRDNFHREEFVNHDHYIEMICNEYDVLLNVGNVSTLQAPSKMLELLSTGKPILNFYFSKDSQYEMIEKYPLGLNIENNEEGAVEKVEKFCHDMKGRYISYEEVEKLFPENKLESQVELLRSLIES